MSVLPKRYLYNAEQQIMKQVIDVCWRTWWERAAQWLVLEILTTVKVDFWCRGIGTWKTSSGEFMEHYTCFPWGSSACIQAPCRHLFPQYVMKIDTYMEGCIPYCFMLLSPLCFPTFCHSAIPKSHYTFDVIYSCLCRLELKFEGLLICKLKM